MAEEPKTSQQAQTPNQTAPANSDRAAGASPGTHPRQAEGGNEPGGMPDLLRKTAKARQRGTGLLRDGIAAIRQVHEAAQKSSNARGEMRALEKELESDRSELKRRETIEANFDDIVHEQEGERQDARNALDAATKLLTTTQDERHALEDQLKAMQAQHEEELHPYRELMESTKSRSDDAASALAEAKRAIKTADQQVTDAAKKREQRIAAANKAVDNAQDRLRRVQSELSTLQADPDASASAVTKMQSEVVAEQAHLDAARNEVTRVTNDCQHLVDNAQTHLWTQKQSFETIERQANEAKRIATARREEYESLYNKAMDEEKALSDGISQRQSVERDAQKDADDAQQRIDDATSALEEANSVHETPELTVKLRQAIAADEARLEELRGEIDRLTKDERTLRDKTRGQRYIVIGTIVVVVIIVLLVVLFSTGALSL